MIFVQDKNTNWGFIIISDSIPCAVVRPAAADSPVERVRVARDVPAGRDGEQEKGDQAWKTRMFVIIESRLHKHTLKSSCSFTSTLSCLSPSPCHVLYFFSCSNFLQVFLYQSLRPHLPNAQFWAVICNDDDVSDKHTDAQTPNCKRVPTQNTTVIFQYSF